MPKTCKKLFYKNIRIVLCRKPLEKHHYSRNATIFFKIAPIAKAIAHAKAIALAKL